ncbi:MAG: hypothetical protein A3E87_02270 [Gammaproteobacteria bacterium RIFCSPHIGHO2_12_FULL_35_23]|nr:MAG: hypothetical protein A3E87_02270 [Gammaproteobacteria bacterium RIFCSPHIGHO2_12_FULL_35_23]
MRRKQKVLFFGAVSLPLIFIIPLVICFLFPNYLLVFLKISFLAPIALLIYFFLPSANKIIQGGSSKPLSTISWLGLILVIEITACFIFIGQLYTLGQYQLQTYQLSSLQFMIWFKEQIAELFFNWGFFPWAFVLFAAIIFYRTKLKNNASHHLTVCLPLPYNTVGNLIRRVFDYYILQSTLCTITLIIGLAAAQVSLLIYPAFSVVLLPITGITIAAIILILGNNKKLEKIFKVIQEKKLAPIKPLLIQWFLLTLIIVVTSFIINRYIMPYNAKAIYNWHPFQFFEFNELPIISQLFFISWWFIATPLLSSLIVYYSTGRTIRLTLIVSLIFPFIMFLIFHYLGMQIFSYAVEPDFIYFMQVIGFFIFLTLFRESRTNQILWFGYMPNSPMHKLRIINPKLLWMLAPTLLGLLSISGLQGLVLTSTLVTFPMIIMYLLLLK